MGDEVARRHPLSLRFRDPDLEAAFREDQARKGARALRAASVFGASVVMFFMLLGVVVPPKTTSVRAVVVPVGSLVGA